MTYRFCFLLLALLSLLCSCGADGPGRDTAGYDHPLADTLGAVREDYAALHLPTALARARRLAVLMDTAGVALPDEVRAEGYQYLAMLHFDRGRYPDSIAVYAAAADDLLREDSPVNLRVRQLLVRTYEGWFQREWIENDMAAALGLAWLEESGVRDTELHGQLLVSQAIARKKYADQLLDQDPRDPDGLRAWRESESILRRAVLLFAKLGSARERQALEELFVLTTRFPDQERTLNEMIARLGEMSCGSSDYVGNTDRLRGYRLQRAGAVDSANYYLRRVINGPEQFNHKYVSEAIYYLYTNARAAGRYGEATDMLGLEMVAVGCCPPGTELPGGAAECLQRTGCVYALGALADIYLDRYDTLQVSGDYRTAERLTDVALDRYVSSFQTLQEESTLNQTLVIGQRLMDVSLKAAVVAATAQDATPEDLDRVFAAMEVSKNFVTTRNVLTSRNAASRERLESLQSDISSRKKRFVRQHRLPLAELVEFGALSRRFRALEAELTTQLPANAAEDFGGPARGLAGVRAALSPGQALVDFAETATALYGLYVDQSVTRLYRVEDSLRILVDTFVEMHRADAPLAPFDRTAHALYAGLLGPVDSLLRTKTELLIIPAASLSGLPFSTLTLEPNPAAGGFSELHYLLDRHSVRYLDSWKAECLHRKLRERKRAGKSVVGVYTSGVLDNYLSELGQLIVARGAPESQHYRHQLCNSNALLSPTQSFDVLHISAHARGNPARLHDNYLHLAPGDSLSGLGLSAVQLPARLVVLAACSTTRGFTSRGVGTFSLRRSLHLAGVPDVVASLYDIPARATGGIMERFYAYYLTDRLLPDQALTRALRDCRAGKLETRWVHPAYWGGLTVG